MTSCVLVTGGSSGIGRSIVEELVKSGRQVVFSFRSNLDRAQDLVSQYGADACGTFFYDAQKGLDGEALANMLTRFGPLSGLINNAGKSYSSFGHEVDNDMLFDCFDTNIRSTVECTRFVWPFLVKQRHGQIVNISSAAVDNVRVGNGLYAASKAFIERYSASLSLEGARFAIAVNNVVPGFVETEMTRNILSDPDRRRTLMKEIPTRKLQRPSDVAKIVLQLFETDVFLTGVRIPITGGSHL